MAGAHSSISNAGRLLALQATIVLCFAVWASSVYSGGPRQSDPSIVDRLWSITPWCYTWWFFLSAPAFDARLLLMATVATVWGARLTWNFYRKGGYSGHEDYRWVEVRKWFPGWQFETFNFFFICFYQLHCTPAPYSRGPP